jgi:hypothetical protein
MDLGLKPTGVDKLGAGPSFGNGPAKSDCYYDFSQDPGDQLDLGNIPKGASAPRGLGPQEGPIGSGNSEIDDVLKTIHDAEAPALGPLPQPSSKAGTSNNNRPTPDNG